MKPIDVRFAECTVAVKDNVTCGLNAMSLGDNLLEKFSFLRRITFRNTVYISFRYRMGMAHYDRYQGIFLCFYYFQRDW